MNAQLPAEGILTRHAAGLWKSYSVPCACGCECTIELSVDIEDQSANFISVHLSSVTRSEHWRTIYTVYGDDWWVAQIAKAVANNVVSKLSLLWSIIVTGHVTTESFTLLTKQQALNLSTALVTAISDIEGENVNAK